MVSNFWIATAMLLIATTKAAEFGCYKGGNQFLLLNGPSGSSSADIMKDINADIDKTCKDVDGKTMDVSDKGYTRCSDFGAAGSDFNSCVTKCQSDCGNMPEPEEGPETNVAFCSLNCKPACHKSPKGKLKPSHLQYQISGAPTAAKITYDICKNALTTELNKPRCWYGSSSIHDGFFFKFDPNDGSCADKKDKPVTVDPKWKSSDSKDTKDSKKDSGKAADKAAFKAPAKPSAPSESKAPTKMSTKASAKPTKAIKASPVPKRS